MSSTSIAIHPKVQVLRLSSVIVQLATSPPVLHFSAVYVTDAALQRVDKSHRPGAHHTGYCAFFPEEKRARVIAGREHVAYPKGLCVLALAAADAWFRTNHKDTAAVDSVRS